MATHGRRSASETLKILALHRYWSLDWAKGRNGRFRWSRQASMCPYCVRRLRTAALSVNKITGYAGLCVKPSDGLEPSTPSL
jgi:hypothetical protein